MGDSYRFKCRKCDFEKEFFIGGGILTEDYWNETEAAEKNLKKRVLQGDYGDHLKRIISGNEKDYRFMCHEELYQCLECRQFSVIREKRIIYNERIDSPYELKVEFKEKCPECDSRLFFKYTGGTTLCPKCGDVLDLVSLGKWD